ncbi:MAG TPA: lactate utilization protein B, partial [Burkholderiaceae bacterium]
SMHFKARAGEKLADARLQANLKKLSTKFVAGRAAAMHDLDDLQATRDAAAAIRDRVIADLDVWLELFEQEATRRGATVLYADSPHDAAQLVAQVAREHGVKRAVKTKSMVSEEMALNRVLEAAGVEVVETDLGEYILQINDNERPSHIIAPVVHKDKEEVAALFARVHGTPLLDNIAQMTQEARGVLRPRFLQAEMGITGGNFLIAETGSVAIVTNEGNEGMCTVLPPKVHVVVTGIEKILPTLSDLATVMRLLPRSATGQSISNYVSLLTGARHAGDEEGPAHMVFVLVDGGRSALVGSQFEAMLRCIRCGACMNHCPVYQKIGGHTYGWVYPGPMGSVLTPLYAGLAQTQDLPQASTLCGECHVVCPVKIPLPDLMRKLRERQFEQRLRPALERALLRLWAWTALHPRIYRLSARAGLAALRLLAGGRRVVSRIPFARGWSDYRDMPAPAPKTFRQMLADRVESRQR